MSLSALAKSPSLSLPDTDIFEAVYGAHYLDIRQKTAQWLVGVMGLVVSGVAVRVYYVLNSPQGELHGVVDGFRRTWDTVKYEQLAKDRKEGGDYINYIFRGGGHMI